jgi:alkanesulfonate monooxygenase SsuD/methylene tetrahydromethanopterin reductase-like flavin-dependent oxidoreductase (luciferase family)
VKLGLALPSFVDDPEIPIAVARRADAAGLDGVFVYDHLWRDRPPPRRGALECVTLLGAVAAETTRIHIGTLVARATLRPPAVLAAAFDTAQRISRGRVIAAIGSGDSESRAENEAFGLPFGHIDTRVQALIGAVEATRGRGYPVWVGGNTRYVREVVALADGWNTWGCSPERFLERSEFVRAVAPKAAMTWGGLALLGRDDAHAAAKAERRELPDNVVAGGPERVAARLRAYAALGAEWVILGPLDASDPENAAILGETVAPLVRMV